MRIKDRRFSVPACVFDQGMPCKQFKLLVFLFSASDFAGTCRPGYASMRLAIRDSDRERGCDTTVRRYLKRLEKEGWIFTMKRTRGRMAIWLQIPPRLRAKDEPKTALLELSRQ